MSTMPSERIPTLTLGWRMKMALDFGGVKVGDMAAHLGMERSALSRWMNDRGTPKNAFLEQWALMTGVDSQWLKTGIPSDSPDGGGSITSTPHYPANGTSSATVTRLVHLSIIQPDSVAA